jgi:hypothetical protein
LRWHLELRMVPVSANILHAPNLSFDVMIRR